MVRLVVVIIFYFGASLSSYAGVEFPLNQGELREYVSDAMERGHLPIRPVDISYVPNAHNPKDLIYCLGGLDRNVFKTGDKLLENLIEAQAICESLRQYVKENPRRQPSRSKFWNKHIKHANSIIASACKKEYSDVEAATQASDRLIVDVYGVFINAIEDYRKTHYNLPNDQAAPQIMGRPRPCSAPQIVVLFSKKPEELSVSYMPAGPWELYHWMRSRNKEAQRPKWSEIGGAAIPDMFGRYYIKAQNPVTKKHYITPDPIRMRKNTEIVCTQSFVYSRTRGN